MIRTVLAFLPVVLCAIFAFAQTTERDVAQMHALVTRFASDMHYGVSPARFAAMTVPGPRLVCLPVSKMAGGQQFPLAPAYSPSASLRMYA